MEGGELVGREPALAGLRRAVDDAAAGRGRLVLISGEAGIGKTDTFKGQLDLEQHGGRTITGVAVRVLQRVLASSDSAGWMDEVIAAYCPQAGRCADPYHVVTWATEALDEQRRIAWNTARGAARGNSRHKRPTGLPKALKNARWALWKNPEDLTDRQREQLAWIAKTNPALHRAWALKEGLRTVFAIARPSPPEAVEALDR